MNSFLQKIAKGKTGVIAAGMLVMGLMAGEKSWGQTLLAGWDFQTAPGTIIVGSPSTQTLFTANVGTGTLYLDGTNGSSSWSQSTELNAFSGTALNAGGATGLSTTTTSPACLAPLGGSGNSANGKTIVFKFSMTGFQNLVVSYATQKTSTGFNSQAWEYSTNGTTWTSAGTAISPATSFSVQTLSTISALNNAATGYLRLTFSGSTGTSQNNRLDNIQLNATAVVSTTNFYSKSTGNLNTLANWGTNTDGTGTAPLDFTTANQVFNIRNNATPTIGAAWTVSGTGSKIVTGDGTNATNFTIPSGFAVTGTVDVAAAATLSIANTTNPTLGTLAATSTVAYTAASAQTVPLASYGNLSVSTTGGNATASGIINVATQLTVSSGSTFDLSTFTLVGATLTTSGTGTLQAGNTGATPIPTGRTWSMDVAYNSASAQTVVAGTYSNLNISGGNRTLINGGTIGVSGTYTPGAGTLTVAGNTINFSSASAQTIPAATYNSITNTGNGVRTLASTGSIDIAGTFTPGTGNYTIGTSTINFNGSTAQSIPVVPVASGANYYNLSYGGSNTASLAGSISIGGSFAQSSGVVAVSNGAVNNSLTIAGDFNMTGGNFNLINIGTATGATVTVTGNCSVNTSTTSGINMEFVASTTGASIFQVNGNASFQGSSTRWVDFGATGTLTGNQFRIKGDLSASGTGTFYTTTANAAGADGFVFNGTGTSVSPQKFTYSTTTASPYVSYIISSGTLMQMQTALVFGGNNNPYSNFTVNGAIDCQSFVISGSLATVNAANTGFTLANGATLITANTGGISASVTALTKNYTAGAKYEFNSTTAAQSTGFTGLTINTPNLITISNTFGAVTADANVTFGNTASLVINPGSILDANTRTFTFGTGGVVIVNGTIRTGNTTATGALSGSATSTIVSTNTPTLTLAGASVVEFNGVAAQFAAARTFPNLTINNSTGVTMLGDVTVTTALALTNGALSIGPNTLTANGVISRTSGVMNGTSSSILTLAGGSAQDLAFSTVSSLSLLNVNKSGGTATLNSGASDSLNIYTGIDFTGNTGTLNLNGKIVAFKSSVTKTAYVGTVAGTFSGATNVTVERYLSARRAWRFLSAPTSGSQTINAAWQEGQANTSYLYSANSNTKPGYGTHITGGAYTNGFDPTQNNASSLRFWSPSSVDGWSLTPPATNATQVNSSTHRAYALFVRGSRNIDMNQGTLAVPDATILRSTGSLNIGNLSRSYAATANQFLLFDNPFVSPVLFTALTSSNINTGFLYVWDPYLGTTGGFQTINGSGIASPGGGSYTNSSTNLIIQSGQAFMVKVTGGTSGQINFLESAKRTNQVIVNKENADRAVTPRFSISLQVATDTSVTTLDGASVYFGKNFSAGVDVRDANKIANYNENLGLLRNGQDLAIETRPLINVTDTLYPHLYNIKIQGYQFEMIPTAMKAAPFTAVLEDAYLQTSTPVSLKVNTVIPFTIDNNPLSYAVTRFRIVFNPKTSVAGEVSSSDEVVAVDNNGTKSVSVYPNPVTGNDIKVAFSNQQAGRYSVTLYTVRGEKVFTQIINHTGGSALVSLTMPSKPSAGLYQLQVADGKSKQVVKVVIQ